jgi:hypothetical protein
MSREQTSIHHVLTAQKFTNVTHRIKSTTGKKKTYSTFRMIKIKDEMSWTCSMQNSKSIQMMVRKPKGRTPAGRAMCRLEEIIKLISVNKVMNTAPHGFL